MRFVVMLLSVVIFSACSGLTSDESGIPEVNGVIQPAVEGSEAYTLGQDIYNARCASCHGIDGEGQFPDAPMQPDSTGRIGAPPHNGSGHTWHHDDDLLLRYIKEGGLGDPDSFYPMPAFGEQLTDEEIAIVLAYIKTMWSPEELARQTNATLAVRQQ